MCCELKYWRATELYMEEAVIWSPARHRMPALSLSLSKTKQRTRVYGLGGRHNKALPFPPSLWAKRSRGLEGVSVEIARACRR